MPNIKNLTIFWTIHPVPKLSCHAHAYSHSPYNSSQNIISQYKTELYIIIWEKGRTQHRYDYSPLYENIADPRSLTCALSAVCLVVFGCVQWLLVVALFGFKIWHSNGLLPSTDISSHWPTPEMTKLHWTIISSKNNQPHHQINSQRAQVSDLGNIINTNLQITKSPGNDFALSVCVSVGRRHMQKRVQYRVCKNNMFKAIVSG